jgi:ABC-2 type transport system ATP-binding protein
VERRDGHLVVTLKQDATDYSFIPTLLIGKGFRLSLFKEEEMNLETAFMHLTKGVVQ